MKFHVLTLFPEMVRQGLCGSIIGRAEENNLIEIKTVNIRDFSADKHAKVDDYTYGGGAGMLMQAQPVYDAWRHVSDEIAGQRERDGAEKRPVRTVYVTPQGSPFTQRMAADLAREEELIFLCGHYEGIDERVLEEIVTDYVSIGDYVLTGGELPAMVMIDAIARLVPGVLHNDDSALTETFYNDLLEYPQYSRPEEWHGKRVPEVLLSGDHSKISAWRAEQSKERTARLRPDLYRRYLEKEELIRQLSANKRHNLHMMESLRRGRAQILCHEGENVLLYDPVSRTYMLRGTEEQAGRMTDLLRLQLQQGNDAAWIAVSQQFWCELLCEEFGLIERMECKQACYTQKNVLPVRHKDIRRLTPEYLLYVAERYTSESAAYLEDRIRSGALYGAFVQGEIAGFMGWHDEGSLGMLYVEPDQRRLGLGSSLEAFCINRQLELGYTPYGHIEVDNEPSQKLQERLGLYLSQESIWWLDGKS